MPALAQGLSAASLNLADMGNPTSAAGYYIRFRLSPGLDKAVVDGAQSAARHTGSFRLAIRAPRGFARQSPPAAAPMPPPRSRPVSASARIERYTGPRR